MPLGVCVPVADVPTPAFPGTVPKEADEPLQGVPPPASPELGKSRADLGGMKIRIEYCAQ